MRLLKGFRTYALNALAAIPPVLVAVAPMFDMPELKAVIPAAFLPWYSLCVVAMNFWLRSITTTPPGKSL